MVQIWGEKWSCGVILGELLGTGPLVGGGSTYEQGGMGQQGAGRPLRVAPHGDWGTLGSVMGQGPPLGYDRQGSALLLTRGRALRSFDKRRTQEPLKAGFVQLVAEEKERAAGAAPA